MSYKTEIKNYIFNVLIALLLLFVGSWGFNQVLEVRDNIAIKQLKDQPSTELFEIYSSTPSRPAFPVGTYPSFWFDSIYYLKGNVTGSNVLICDDYRSGEFEASGFISDDHVNQRPAFTNAFTVNSALPDFPTSCILRSTITLCTATYPEVCKTQSSDSDWFKFE